MLRNFLILLLAGATGAIAGDQHDVLDAAFDKVPFEQWLHEGSSGHLRWSMSVGPARLSFHQRLEATATVTVDGRDLETKRGQGELVFFIQVTDRQGIRYQVHNSIDLNKLDEDVRHAQIEASQRAFLLPGEYKLSTVILDSKTGEHDAKEGKFRIPMARQAIFEEAWRNLPAVEFIGNLESPDSWFLPDVHGRLSWAANLPEAARLNVILNVASSTLSFRERATPSGGLAALLPTLRVLTESGSATLQGKIEVLDLSSRKVVFHQENVHELDWPALKLSLGETSTASIDVHALSDRHHDAQFFVSEVRKITRSSEGPSVLVVLTTAVAFGSGEDLEPVSTEALPPCKVIYIRYRNPPERGQMFDQRMGGRGRGMRMGGPMSRGVGSGAVVDQLEGTMKPMKPKVFDVETAEEMTKAIVEIKALLEGSSSR